MSNEDFTLVWKRKLMLGKKELFLTESPPPPHTHTSKALAKARQTRQLREELNKGDKWQVMKNADAAIKYSRLLSECLLWEEFSLLSNRQNLTEALKMIHVAL